MTRFYLAGLLLVGVVTATLTAYWILRSGEADSTPSRAPAPMGDRRFSGFGPSPYSSDNEEAAIRIVGVGEKIPEFTIEDVTTGRRWTRVKLLASGRPIIFLYGSIT